MQALRMPKRDTDAASPLHGGAPLSQESGQGCGNTTASRRFGRHDDGLREPPLQVKNEPEVRRLTGRDGRSQRRPFATGVMTWPCHHPQTAAARNASAARSCSTVRGRDVPAPPLLPRLADTPLVSTLPGKYHCPLRGCALQSWTINARPFVTARPPADAARRADGIRLSEDSLPRPPYPCFQKP